MRIALFIFLLSMGFIGSIANGKQYLCENETGQLEDCETPEPDETDVQSFFLLLSFSKAPSWRNSPPAPMGYEYLFPPFPRIKLDKFTPPPDLSRAWVFQLNFLTI